MASLLKERKTMGKLCFSQYSGDSEGLLHHKGVREGLIVSRDGLVDFCQTFLRGSGYIVTPPGDDDVTAEIPIRDFLQDQDPGDEYVSSRTPHV